MSNSSSIQLTLGYANPSEDPDINAVLSRRSFIGDINNPDDIEASIDIESQQNEADFDGNLDGFKHFVQLIDGREFTQTIAITNNGHRRAKNVKFKVDVSNSKFARLTELEIASDSDVQSGVNGLGHISIDGTNQTAIITVHNIHPGQTLILNAISTIDQQAFNHDDSDDIDVRNLGLTLTDTPDVLDWGTGSVSIDEHTGESKGRIYLDPEGFEISEGLKGKSGFSFEEFAKSTLTVTPKNFYGHKVFQEAETLRGYAEYEGIDSTPDSRGNFTREKTVFFTDFTGDVDATYGGGVNSRSDELSLNDFITFLWLNRPDLADDVDHYLEAAEHADPHNPEDLNNVYHQLLGLFDEGLGNQVYSTNQLFGQEAQFNRNGLEIDGENQGGFTQDVIGSDLVNGAASDFEILTFDHLSGDGFGDFVDDNATDPNTLYRIDILEASALHDLRWDHFTEDNVALVVIPAGEDVLRITNGNGNDVLDLSNTLVATSTSTGVDPTTGNLFLFPSDQTGIKVWSRKGDDRVIGTSDDDIIAGNRGNDTLTGGRGDDKLRGGRGHDILRGGIGDDTVIGGKDNDIFVIAEGEGTNQIRDFRQRHDHDLIGLADGLTFGQLDLNDGSKIKFGDETLAILEGVDASTLTEDDFTTDF